MRNMFNALAGPVGFAQVADDPTAQQAMLGIPPAMEELLRRGRGQQPPPEQPMPQQGEARPVQADAAPGRRGFWDVVGEVSDVISASRGAPGTYALAEDRKRKLAKEERELQQQQQFTNAMGQWLKNPNDPSAWQGMMVSPDLAEKAFKLRESDAGVRAKQFDRTSKLDAVAMRLLGAARDQGSYDRARGIIGRLFGQHGVNVEDMGLPEQFSPDLVEEFRLRGTDPRHQLEAERLGRRLDWDIEDDVADNDRATRNTESLIDDRTGRRGEQRRHHDLTDTTRRRGQDLQSETQRRGQDTRATTTQRGQDLRPTTSRGSSSRKSSLTTATGAKGEKYEFDGKTWVQVN